SNGRGFTMHSLETARFCLLGALVALYMMAGAAVFSCLERPQELKAHQLWKMRLRTFSEEHNISEEELKSLLHHYDEARTAGVHSERGRALWDFPGAFYFVGTVVSTIGFGVTAPSTGAGKVLLVFYGSLGCSAAILFFNLFLERLITSISLFMFWCHTRKSGPEDKNSERDSSDERKPSVYQITLLLLLVVLVVACSAASLYSPMEGWTYLESLYFCFVAFSTVGFGDFVSSQKEHHEDIRAYQMSNCLLMLLGVCCTYSLFNAISVIINKGLSWILIKVNWVDLPLFLRSNVFFVGLSMFAGNYLTKLVSIFGLYIKSYGFLLILVKKKSQLFIATFRKMLREIRHFSPQQSQKMPAKSWRD
uniref:Potassium channel subfamily K member 13-like n=1 Tax=Kryptolebias marmoratus TaxID=37003 RepID=A0A3Q3BQN5_KRYMA